MSRREWQARVGRAGQGRRRRLEGVALNERGERHATIDARSCTHAVLFIDGIHSDLHLDKLLYQLRLFFGREVKNLINQLL